MIYLLGVLTAALLITADKDMATRIDLYIGDKAYKYLLCVMSWLFVILYISGKLRNK